MENPAPPVETLVAGFAELTPENADLSALRVRRRRGAPEALARRLREDGAEVRGPVEHPGEDRSIDFRDPAGNLVEGRDFFAHGDGARHGVRALA